MNPDEIVVDRLDSERVDMVFEPLAETVGETGKPAQRHPDREIVALDH